MEGSGGPSAGGAASSYPSHSTTIVSIPDRFPGTQPVEEVWEGNES